MCHVSVCGESVVDLLSGLPLSSGCLGSCTWSSLTWRLEQGVVAPCAKSSAAALAGIPQVTRGVTLSACHVVRLSRQPPVHAERVHCVARAWPVCPDVGEKQAESVWFDTTNIVYVCCVCFVFLGNSLPGSPTPCGTVPLALATPLPVARLRTGLACKPESVIVSAVSNVSALILFVISPSEVSRDHRLWQRRLEAV